MKTLQNNFTTPEQSKRLLELGVPADSADCAIDLTLQDKYHIIVLDCYDNYSYFIEKSAAMFGWKKPTLPCWSVGRLIEILGIISGAPCINNMSTNNIICHLLDIFDIKADSGTLDFSKLEE